ncbi:MAG TPA: hypothetical protein VH620_08395 [Gaiella sp.]
MRRAAAVALASVVALSLPAAAGAATVHLEQFVATGGSVQVSVVVRKPASFSVLLRTRTTGRTQLVLLGRHAPRGGPLLDTATTRCDGAAGSYYCSGSYEPLPPGTYTFRVRRPSGFGTHVELTVRW